MPTIVDLLHADDPRDVIHKLVQALAEGELVGLPTETGYSAAAFSAHPSAAANLKAIIQGLEIADCALGVKSATEAIDYLPGAGPVLQKLLRRFWPGPVTLSVDARLAAGLTRVLPEPTRAALLAGGCLSLRMPGGDTMAAVLRLIPAPLLLSGEISARGERYTTAEDLARSCGDRLSLIADGGAAKYAAPTTIVHVDVEGWDVAREGVVSRRTLNRLAGNLYLFVCTGNTCRSPMAESLFRKLLAERLNCSEDDLVDRGHIVASAGVSAVAGCPPSPEAVEVLKDRGVDLRGHESQPITSQLLAQADRIFTMTRGHRDVLLREFPETASRVSLLARDGSDVSDPIGAPLEEYRRCAEIIERHLRSILNELPLR